MLTVASATLTRLAFIMARACAVEMPSRPSLRSTAVTGNPNKPPSAPTFSLPFFFAIFFFHRAALLGLPFNWPKCPIDQLPGLGERSAKRRLKFYESTEGKGLRSRTGLTQKAPSQKHGAESR